MFRRSKNSNKTTRQPVRDTVPRERQSVFSYRAVRQVRDGSTDRQPEVMQQRQKVVRSAARQRAQAITLVVVFGAVFIYLSWLGGAPRVIVLGSATNQSLLQNTDVYEQAAAKLLTASIANHNKLTLDASGIASKLEQAYPELASVSVQSTLFGHKPIIYVAPALPTLELVTTANTTFVLAASGKVLAPADMVADLASLHLPVVADQSGLQIQIDSGALPSTDVTFIQTVLEQLQAHKLVGTGLTLPQGTSELDVHISGQPYYIKFNLEAAAPQQIGTFLAVNSYLQSKNITPGQYIDVRVPGRAYYK